MNWKELGFILFYSTPPLLLIPIIIMIFLHLLTQSPTYLRIAWTLLAAMAIYDLIAVIKILKGPRPHGKGRERP